ASSFVDYAPSFSPDGKHIAFESWRSGEAEEIWTADPDGSDPFQVTRGPVDWQGQPRGRGNPTWAPDGRIAYGARGDVGNPDVWIVNADGSSPRRLTDDALNDGLPIWSPDGQWIYYRQDRSDGSDFVRVAASGGKPQRITHHGAVYATLSSDG